MVLVTREIATVVSSEYKIGSLRYTIHSHRDSATNKETSEIGDNQPGGLIKCQAEFIAGYRVTDQWLFKYMCPWWFI